MTESGAIKNLKDILNECTESEEAVCYVTSADAPALDMAIKALEKQKGAIAGWILCSERFPDECVPVNVTWINRNPEPYYAKIKDVPFSATAVHYNDKWYWYSSTCIDFLTEYGENNFDLVDKDIDIIAWMELPSAYIPKENNCVGCPYCGKR